MKNPKKILEKELFTPLHNYFEKLGYMVHGEVKDCDLTASKGEELIIVELKRSLNLELLIQAAKRQNITEKVYAAIPRPNWSMSSKKRKDTLFILRRLGLGLITISLKKDAESVEVLLNPSPADKQRNPQKKKREKRAVADEIHGRHGNFNLGGSTGVKLMTAYRENTIHIACCLKRFGPLSTVKLRELGTGNKTQPILHANYYGWFERVGRGIYKLSGKSSEIFEKYPELAAYYENILDKNTENK